MAGLTFRPAVQSDHGSLEALFAATPMGSRIRIGFERDPDYFAGARVQTEELCVRAFFETCGRAVGMFSAGSRRVWVDGEMEMRYLSDLRIHPEWQGSSLLARGFRLMRQEVFRPGEWAQTLVLEDNLRALELLTSRRGGLPEYRPAGRYVSRLLPSQQIDSDSGIHVRRATIEDLGRMQELLDASARRRSFACLVDLADLGKATWRDVAVFDFLVAEKHGKIVGMMGLWDQSGFQRLRIHGYSRAVAALRPVWNLLGGMPLPEAGHIIPLCKTTGIACEDDDPRILRAMLAMTLAGNSGRLLLAGCSAEDPLAAAFHGLKGRKDHGRHFLVGWEGKPPDWREPFAFDVARI